MPRNQVDEPAQEKNAYKLTAEVRDTILALFKGGCGYHHAATVAAKHHEIPGGLSRSGIYRCAELDPKFKEQLEEARAYAHDRVERKLFDACMAQRGWAISMYLYNRRPEDWRPRREEGATAWDPDSLEIHFIDGFDKDGKRSKGPTNGAPGNGDPTSP